jgi:peptidoglycan/xylan/chitin deacetylase (PgdA/CDA1 family)
MTAPGSAKLNDSDLDTEFNSTSIIFNEITGGNINYLRPPYGIYNDKVIEKSPYPLILWNIDTKDWLTRDSNKIYDNIINSVCDGCIVLLHDTYKETIDALKITLPVLKEKGYEVVSISNLLKAKNKEIKRGEIIKKID